MGATRSTASGIGGLVVAVVVVVGAVVVVAAPGRAAIVLGAVKRRGGWSGGAAPAADEQCGQHHEDDGATAEHVEPPPVAAARRSRPRSNSPHSGTARAGPAIRDRPDAFPEVAGGPTRRSRRRRPHPAQRPPGEPDPGLGEGPLPTPPRRGRPPSAAPSATRPDPGPPPPRCRAARAAPAAFRSAISHSGSTMSRSQYRRLGLRSPGRVNPGSEARATLWARPMPLSSMPPHHTGMPWRCARSWHRLRRCAPPTRPGLMLMMRTAPRPMASAARAAEVIDSSRQIGGGQRPPAAERGPSGRRGPEAARSSPGTGRRGAQHLEVVDGVGGVGVQDSGNPSPTASRAAAAKARSSPGATLTFTRR